MKSVTPKGFLRHAALVMALMLLLALPAALGEAAHPFAGGDGTEASPYEIETAEQLDGVRDYLSGHFILTADIDLSGYASWQPIGIYVPNDMAAGDYSADQSVAFTGSFDGNGHTLSGLSISRDDLSAEDMTGTGLFGAIAGEATLQNLTLENVAVSSTGSCVAALVGMAMSASEQAIMNITLSGANTISGGGSVAGLVGSAQDTNIIRCSASADVTMTSVGNGAGILGGGLEGGVILGCSATGTVTAIETMLYDEISVGPLGIGGLAGCAFEALEIEECRAENVVITVGEYASMIGGLVGYSGVVNEGPFATDPEGFTRIRNCTADNVTISAGAGATRIGGIVGSGFTGSNYITYYPAASAIHVIGCTASGIIEAGDNAMVGSILGYAYQNCAVVSCDGSGMAGTQTQVGAAEVGEAVMLVNIK